MRTLIFSYIKPYIHILEEEIKYTKWWHKEIGRASKRHERFHATLE